MITKLWVPVKFASIGLGLMIGTYGQYFSCLIKFKYDIIIVINVLGVSADLAPILPVLSLPVLPALTLPVPVSSSTTSTTWWQQFPHVVISGSTGTDRLTLSN